jgi:adenosylmethionine-8-amino-7-oxononanoate aminotransferase
LIPRETSTWIPLTIQTSVDPLISITRAQGEFLYDELDNEYIDGTSSWWTSIFGHCHPKLVSAISKQAQTLDHVMLAGFIHSPAEDLAARLISLSEGLFRKIFYSDNGSNAVEIALKLAVQYFQNKAGKSENQKTRFITFSSSYHGDSIGAMNVSGLTFFNRIFSALRFQTKEFVASNCNQCPWGKKKESCKIECLDGVEEELKTHSSLYAAIVIEPLVFGASGMIFYDKAVLRKLDGLAKKYDVLLILDEVFTGMGRTGLPFAFQTAGIKPDLIAIAKGLTGGSLPLAATLVSSEIYESFLDDDPYASFFHAHTMTGNPIACSAGLASVNLLLDEGLSLVQSLETKLRSRLENLQKQFPQKVLYPRTLGAICAFDLPESIGEDEYLNPIGKRLRLALLEHRVLLRPLGKTVYITPPYTIADGSLDLIFSALMLALAKM